MMTRYWSSTGRRTHVVLLVGVVFALVTLAAFLIMSSTGSAAQSAAPSAPTTNFDANMQPPAVAPVYYVSGSPYEMGYQYGQQAKDLIARNTCIARARALRTYHAWAAVVAAMQANAALVAAKTPDMIQMWHGIADGTGLSYEEIRLLNVNLAPPSGCSTISLWGTATKDHQLIAGRNTDTGWLGSSGCVLVGFPDNGNSFIGGTMVAGTLGGGMNGKGLVCMGAAGEGARPQDHGPGYPEMAAYGYILEHSDNANQATDMWLSLAPKGCLNIHFVDTTPRADVVEYTAAGHAVRKPGDFGEKDYLLATNMFLTKTMRPANDPNQLQDWDLDDWYRYGTEEKLIQQNYGALTVGKLMQILGCHDYYGTRDPVTGAVDTTKPQTWHRDVLSTQPASDPQSEWTPGMRDLYYTPSMRVIYLPGAKTEYIMTGNDDPLFSWTPNATGEFCKLVLADNPGGVTAQALADAQLQTWYGAVALHRSGHPTAARLAELNEAKAAIAKGMNLQVQAGLASDPNQAQLLLGQATTSFCAAQCYAEQAQGIVSNSGRVPPSS